MAKITVAPYKAGTINHATMNKMAKNTDTTYIYWAYVVGYNKLSLLTLYIWLVWYVMESSKLNLMMLHVWYGRSYHGE